MFKCSLRRLAWTTQGLRVGHHGKSQATPFLGSDDGVSERWATTAQRSDTRGAGDDLFGVGGDLHFDDLVRIRRWLTLGDPVDMFHAFTDDTPDCVLSVQEFCVSETDKELAITTVWILGAGHADRSAHERRAGKLGLQLLARATHAGTGRVTGLGHEAVDDPVEDDPVIETLTGQFLDPRDVLGSDVWT